MEVQWRSGSGRVGQLIHFGLSAYDDVLWISDDEDMAVERIGSGRVAGCPSPRLCPPFPCSNPTTIPSGARSHHWHLRDQSTCCLGNDHFELYELQWLFHELAFKKPNWHHLSGRNQWSYHTIVRIWWWWWVWHGRCCGDDGVNDDEIGWHCCCCCFCCCWPWWQSNHTSM